MLDLGATYIDAYVRRILADALAYAFEDGFINGDGNGKPIGMLKDPEGAVKANAYTEKTATKLTSLDVKSYMDVVAKLAKGKGGKTNNITSVDLIVNPVDYLTKIIPATTVLATDGSYKNNLFPFPTNVYPSEMVTEGTAVIGQLSRYKPASQQVRKVSLITLTSISFSKTTEFILLRLTQQAFRFIRTILLSSIFQRSILLKLR